MLRGQPLHAVPQLSRRSFFMTLCGVTVTPSPVTAAPGFHVTDVLTASDVEHDLFFIGVQFGLTAAPKTEPHRLLRSYVGQRVHVHVEPA